MAGIESLMADALIREREARVAERLAVPLRRDRGRGSAARLRWFLASLGFATLPISAFAAPPASTRAFAAVTR